MKFLRKLLLAAILLGAIGAGGGWYIALKPNTVSLGDDPFELRIYEGAQFAEVLHTLDTAGVLTSLQTFEWMSSALDYPDLVKPGRYLIKGGMNNLELVRKLRSGDQDETRITFIARRTPEDLAAAITENIQVTPEEFLRKMRDTSFIHQLGFNEQNIMSMFIPNTYNVFWTISVDDLFERLKRTYEDFWTDARKEKAISIGLTPKEVSVLASIVQAETQVVSERPTVAGLYMNRLNRKMLLQADPTVIFAVGDFSIKRVLNRHLEVDSPYNTYKYPGLPPGPINCPDISSIDAVLDYEHHEYLFMCAKCDLSGHNFSKTLSQHLQYAREYQQCLNKKNIR